jgi:hypothetical protein
MFTTLRERYNNKQPRCDITSLMLQIIYKNHGFPKIVVKYYFNNRSKFTGTYFIATTLHCQQNNVSEYQLLRFNTIILRVYIPKCKQQLRTMKYYTQIRDIAQLESVLYVYYSQRAV